MGNFGDFLTFKSFIFVGHSYAYALRPFHVGFRVAANHVISPDRFGGAGGAVASLAICHNPMLRSSRMEKKKSEFP